MYLVSVVGFRPLLLPGIAGPTTTSGSFAGLVMGAMYLRGTFAAFGTTVIADVLIYFVWPMLVAEFWFLKLRKEPCAG